MRYAVAMNDGSVAIMEIRKDVDPATEVKRWPEKEAAKVVAIHLIDEATQMPTNREFRNAWEFADGAVCHNMVRAADIHMARIRATRNARLAKLDLEVVKSISDKAAIEHIEAEKRSLRDIPQTYEAALRAAKTIDELKAIWPVELT